MFLLDQGMLHGVASSTGNRFFIFRLRFGFINLQSCRLDGDIFARGPAPGTMIFVNDYLFFLEFLEILEVSVFGCVF